MIGEEARSFSSTKRSGGDPKIENFPASDLQVVSTIHRGGSGHNDFLTPKLLAGQAFWRESKLVTLVTTVISG
jgi:hypothetical protein